MVAKRIKKPHPLNKRCNRCPRCRSKTLYGISSLSRILFKVTRRPQTDKPETEEQETVFADQPYFPLPPATIPDTKTVFVDQPNSPLPPATNPDTETVLLNQPNFLLPPATNPDTKTVFLDLDSTLIYASRKKSKNHDFTVPRRKNSDSKKFYILKRPGVDEFLEFLGKKKFEVVLFTAGSKKYAKPIVKILDENKVISYRLYRNSCKNIDKSYVKDLSETGRDLKKVLIVDDTPQAIMLQPENLYQITPFKDDLEDKELWKLIKFLEVYEGSDDLRQAIRDFAPSGLQTSNLGGSDSPPDATATRDEKASSSNTSGGYG